MISIPYIDVRKSAKLLSTRSPARLTSPSQEIEEGQKYHRLF
jgi:hypothetical protein